jgi:hypothetical protein
MIKNGIWFVNIYNSLERVGVIYFTSQGGWGRRGKYAWISMNLDYTLRTNTSSSWLGRGLSFFLIAGWCENYGDLQRVPKNGEGVFYSLCSKSFEFIMCEERESKGQELWVRQRIPSLNSVIKNFNKEI